MVAWSVQGLQIRGFRFLNSLGYAMLLRFSPRTLSYGSLVSTPSK